MAEIRLVCWWGGPDGGGEEMSYKEWRRANNLPAQDGWNPWAWTFSESCEYLAYVVATGGPDWVEKK